MLEPVNKVFIPAIAQPHWLCTLCSIVKFLDAVQYRTVLCLPISEIELSRSTQNQNSRWNWKMLLRPPLKQFHLEFFMRGPAQWTFTFSFCKVEAKQKVKLQFTDSSNTDFTVFWWLSCKKQIAKTPLPKMQNWKHPLSTWPVKLKGVEQKGAKKLEY